MNSSIRNSIKGGDSLLFCLYAIIAAFSTYACMYAFRKPITVGFYEQASFWGFSLKALYLSSQIAGYALSKFIGIKFISELKSKGRARTILILISFSWLALLGFAVIPAPWNIPMMFLNGLPLGMVWGVVFSYLEGRRTTEILAAGLCTSFIIASGLVKTVGSYLTQVWAISEYWMPALTGLMFFPLLYLSVRLLDKVPPPSPSDVAARSERPSMCPVSRRDIVRSFGPGLLLLISGYIFLTILRDLRDNFAANIWQETGYLYTPETFTLTEIPITIIVLGMVALLKLVRSNHVALLLNHLLIGAGFIMIFFTTQLYKEGQISSLYWMIFNGIGLYLAYIPFATSLFERLIATFRKPANVGFLTYLADSYGYLATVGVMVYQSFGEKSLKWNLLLIDISLLTGVVGVLLTLTSLVYFYRKSTYFRMVKIECKNVSC